MRDAGGEPAGLGAAAWRCGGQAAQWDALDDYLDDGWAAAEALADAAARRRALMAHLLDSRQRILSAMDEGEVDASNVAERAGQLELVRHGTDRWLSMLRRFRFRERARVARPAFRIEACGVYPFRDADHGEVRLVEVVGDSSGYADVEPFTCPRASRRARAAASLRWLVPRRVTEADLRRPGEQALIGQWGLFARRAIPAGTCLGVYGGQLLDEVDLFVLQDDRYLMAASDVLGQVSINGENIMSLMNTLFETDASGEVTGHPPDGYNVTAATYRVVLRHGWQARIRAFRASEDIAAGCELRWNYGLGEGVP
ncbi:hypothetical protein [Ideonella sp.]|uniref:hypothetical protein n=1 Tax=Ideonella sp. TaxID=1929293 RepID=UPI0035B0FADC